MRLFVLLCIACAICIVAAFNPPPPPAPQPPIDHAPQMQARRTATIQQLQRQGAIGRIDCGGKNVLDPARLWVRPAFYLLDFDDKAKLVGIIYAYCYTEISANHIVLLKDQLSGKTTFTYSTALGLESK
jgi:hypothetical protein